LEKLLNVAVGSTQHVHTKMVFPLVTFEPVTTGSLAPPLFCPGVGTCTHGDVQVACAVAAQKSKGIMKSNRFSIFFI